MGNSIPERDVGLLLGKSENTIWGYSTREKGRVYDPKNGVPYPEGMINLVRRVTEIEEKNSKSSVQERREKAEQKKEELGIIYDLIKRTPYGLFIRYFNIIKEGLEKGKRRISLLKKILEEEDLRKRYPHFNGRELDMSLDKLTLLTLKKIKYVKRSVKRNPTHKRAKRQEVLSRLETKYRAIYTLRKNGVFDRN